MPEPSLLMSWGLLFAFNRHALTFDQIVLKARQIP